MNCIHTEVESDKQQSNYVCVDVGPVHSYTDLKWIVWKSLDYIHTTVIYVKYNAKYKPTASNWVADLAAVPCFQVSVLHALCSPVFVILQPRFWLVQFSSLSFIVL